MKRSPHIVVVGSLNMDLVVSSDAFPHKGETIEGHAIHYVAGGKGANQAVACARLGASVTMIGAVGKDSFGETLMRTLSAEGIDISRVEQLQGVATGIASIIHAEGDNSIIVVGGANGEVTPAFIEQHQQCIREADVLLVQLEIPMAAVMCALRIAHEASVTTVLNPAPAKKLPEELLCYVHYVTPNETELLTLIEAEVLPLPEEPSLAPIGQAIARERHYESLKVEESHTISNIAYIERLLAAYPSSAGLNVVLTLGSEGAMLYQNKQFYTVSAPKVSVMDTTGAGDCLNGAFAVALSRGYDAQEALSLAVKAASISVTAFGAQAGMPTWEQLETHEDKAN